MQPTNSDGTWRRWDVKKQFTMRSRITAWVEDETYRLAVMGMSYREIATHIADVAHGRQRPIAPIPDGLTFRPDYRISFQAVAMAYNRVIDRIPVAEVERFRKLQTERCEAMILALQGGISKGNARSIEVGVHVLAHEAKLNNLAPAKLEVTGKDGAPLTIVEMKQILVQLEEHREPKPVAQIEDESFPRKDS